jgi:hypothetical protein
LVSFQGILWFIEGYSERKLLDEAIKAPLRSLDYFFGLISDNAESSLEMIEKRIFDKLMDKSDESTDKQMRELAKDFYLR